MSIDIRESVRRMLRPGERALLAVSGGIDSMVMLDAATRTLGERRIVVATFDHGTGEGATAASALVAQWCERAGVDCIRERATEPLATEEELRAARWQFLREAASRATAVIAIAHTADDHVETVFMRILRGAGARGIAGLLAPSAIRRPLLGSSRADVMKYAIRHRVPWIEDPSNESRRFLRNRVRHDLLPALVASQPQLLDELRELSARAAALRADVEHLVRADLGVRLVPSGIDIPLERLHELSAEGLALVWPAAAALAGATLDRRAIARVVAFTQRARVGSRVPVAGGWEVIRARDALQLRASGLLAPGESVLSHSLGIQWGDWSIRPSDIVGSDAWTAWLPRDGALSIRPWRAGDVLAPSGRSGRQRKVKHLLSKAGVNGHERASWPVVVWEGDVVWVPGVSRSDAATARSGRPVLAFVCEHNR
jgi:tRNA(Ile)-lysidine synthase